MSRRAECFFPRHRPLNFVRTVCSVLLIAKARRPGRGGRPDPAAGEAGKQIDRAVHVEVAEDGLVRRLSGRWLCPKGAAIYHDVSAPPAKAGVCDKCGSEWTQRSDDKPDIARNRLKVNIENMQSLLDHYAGQDKLTTVDGGRDPEAVAADLRKALEG